MQRSIFITVVVALFVAGCRTTHPRIDASTSTRVGNSAQEETVAKSHHQNRQPGQPFTTKTQKATNDGSQKIRLASLRQPLDSVRPEPLPIQPQVVDTVQVATTALSLADLQGIAVQNNPAINEAAARVAAARGQWLQVGLPPNPEIGYSGQQLGSGGSAEQNGGYIAQEFVRGNKLGLSRNVASWQVQQAQQELADAQQRVATDVQLAYYAVLIAQKRRELADELLQIGLQGKEAADALFKAEEVSEADPIRAGVEVETARILVQTAANQHHEAWRRLSAVLGVPGMPMQPIAGELEINSMPLVWQETLQHIFSASPEIGAVNAEIEAARWAIQRACAEAIPNVELQAVIQDDRGTNSVNGNIQVTLPLPLWNRNQGGVQKANAEAVAAQRKYERIALDLQQRLADAFQRSETARNQIEQFSRDDGILDKTNRSLTLIRKGYEADELGIIDLLNAQRRYFETRLTYLDAQQQYWVATTEIQGLLLSGSLGD